MNNNDSGRVVLVCQSSSWDAPFAKREDVIKVTRLALPSLHFTPKQRKQRLQAIFQKWAAKI